MAGIKEIRTKIKSVQNTRKITKAMEMVAASKMRKAQDRMRAGRPYATRVRAIASHLMQANPDYTHPYMVERGKLTSVGIILVTTDKGLCGGLNTNISRLVLAKIKEFEHQGISVQTTALGTKGLGLLTRIGAKVVSSEVQLGDAPNLDRLIGAIKAQIDGYLNGKVDAVYLATSRFVNTMQSGPDLREAAAAAVGSRRSLPDGCRAFAETLETNLRLGITCTSHDATDRHRRSAGDAEGQAGRWHGTEHFRGGGCP
ncbi:ATP synthase gamma chain [Castellaniella defragrans]